MTSIEINKQKFVNDCILEYRSVEEYDLTVVYDTFFYRTFNISDVSKTLYDELYLLVENELVNEYESDAETDSEN